MSAIKICDPFDKTQGLCLLRATPRRAEATSFSEKVKPSLDLLLTKRGIEVDVPLADTRSP
jgi:hypothetical protein